MMISFIKKKLINIRSVYMGKSIYAWSYTSAPQYVFMAWCLVRLGDNFTFTLVQYMQVMF